MFSNLIAKAVLIDDPEDEDGSDYRAIGTAWFDETEPDLLERISLTWAGWRDGRRGLVGVAEGRAHSAYLDALRAEALAEIVSLAQLRHSQLAEAQDEIERLAFSIPCDEERLEELEDRLRAARRREEQATAQPESEGTGSPDGAHGNAAHPSDSAVDDAAPKPARSGAPALAVNAAQDERERSRLLRSIRSDRTRLISLRAQQAFLQRDAEIKLSLLIERYRERAARYLRAADACRRPASYAEAEPPCIREDARAILEQALCVERFGAAGGRDAEADSNGKETME